MAIFLPFRGVLPPVERASQVAAVPYDVVNTQEAAELAKGNPWSFLHVSRPEIDLEPGIDLHDDKVYAQAKIAYDKLCAEVPLTQDEKPHLYVYRLIMNGRSQTGVIGAASAAEYNSGVIKKHEKTRADKEDDRTRHVMTLRSHTGPAFLTYQDSDDIDAIINEEMAKEPLFDFTAVDGIQHTLWRMDEDRSRELSVFFQKEVSCFYIADGHHRSAAAARTAAECAPNNPNHTGNEDYNYFLAVAFPSRQLAILPYNRVVRHLNNLSPASFLTMLNEKFIITPAENGTVDQPGRFNMYIAGEWYQAIPTFNLNTLGVIDKLDVSVLQNYVLNPLLGIEDPRTSKDIDFIGGIRGTQELERLVDSGDYVIAFSMYPTTVDQLMDIADAGEIMPPKSTWFEPKLRDGLVCHNF